MSNQDLRYQQAHKEALWAFGLALAYMAWWYLSAYGLAPSVDEPLTLYFGVPLWFLMSCLIGPLVFIIIAIFMIKYIFKPISLD